MANKLNYGNYSRAITFFFRLIGSGKVLNPLNSHGLIASLLLFYQADFDIK